MESGFHSRSVKVCEFYEDLYKFLALRGLSCIRLGEEADNIKNELKLSKKTHHLSKVLAMVWRTS